MTASAPSRAALAGILAWGGLRAPPPRARFLVVDALDDFPGQASAAALLAERTEDVVAGAALLARAAGATPFVAVPEGAPRAPGHDAARRLDVPRLHPLGEPRILGRWLAGLARFDGAAPADFAVVPAAEAAAAAASARGRPDLSAWITVTGRVRDPATLRVPLGTPVATLVRLAGGGRGTAVPYVVRRGRLRRASSSRGVTAADAALVLLGDGHALARNDALSLDALLRRADSACARCGLCDAACPAGEARPARVLDLLRAPGAAGTAALPGITACSGCRVCETVCPAGLGVGRIAAAAAERARAGGAPAGTSRRIRLIPREAMRSRLGLGADPEARRDATSEVRRVRFDLGDGPLRALRRAGDRVWAGEPIAVAPDGARVLAPFAATVVVAGRTVTLRRIA